MVLQAVFWSSPAKIKKHKKKNGTPAGLRRFFLFWESQFFVGYTPYN